MSHTGNEYNNKIYYWGGYDAGLNNLNTVSIYDISSNSWSSGTAGGTARYGHSSAIYNGKIYYWGGYNDVTHFNSIDVYDILSDSWSTKTSGGTARDGHEAQTYNNSIYHWGGVNAAGTTINTVDIYNITTNSWSTGIAGGTARSFFGSALYDGRVYNWGGYNSSADPINTLDIYDTGYHPNPEFANLPGTTTPINITDGQVVTTPTYTIEVKPTSPNEIEKVEFYIDNTLIDTDYTADSNGVYSTIWDTTIYHSNIRVVAYDPFDRSTELTRTAIVQAAATPTPSPTSTATTTASTATTSTTSTTITTSTIQATILPITGAHAVSLFGLILTK